MDHLKLIYNLEQPVSDDFQKRATGKYYTHKNIADHMYRSHLRLLSKEVGSELKIVDPFAGDGRLVVWFIELWVHLGLPRILWDIYLCDINPEGLEHAARSLDELKLKGVNLKYAISEGDSFRLLGNVEDEYDVVVTNPPWELLKPDRRELLELSESAKEAYLKSMRGYDLYLKDNYPLSQPKSKYGGWGTNLSRVGAELTYQLCKKDGFCYIVLPASFFADAQSHSIRKEFMENGSVQEIAYYPAEAKLFGKADVSSVSLVYQKNEQAASTTRLTVFDRFLNIKNSDEVLLRPGRDQSWIVPVTLGVGAIGLLDRFQSQFQPWADLEGLKKEIWAGREIDETGSRKWLVAKGAGPTFVKGRMIGRYRTIERATMYVDKVDWTPPVSCGFNRIAWRDVSRPSQKRRVIATIIPKGTVAGNSLGVVYFKSSSESALYGLLAIMNSLCFEFQLRCYLASGHVSLAALRKVHVPDEDQLSCLQVLSEAAKSEIEEESQQQARLEAIVARDVYRLEGREFRLLIDSFDKLSEWERNEMMEEFENI